MDAEKIYFDNASLEKPSLAQGEIERKQSRRGVKSAVYSIHPRIADEIGAELFVHEFNEVAIFDALSEVRDIDSFYHLADISHNLNVEGDNGYTEEKNLLHGYIRAEKLPCIDKVFTPEDTNRFRIQAYGEILPHK
jgi:hypothetical protein